MRKIITPIAVAFLALAFVASSALTQRLSPQGGTITSVNGGSGLVGSAQSGPVTVAVGSGSGILVSADAVSVDQTYVQRRISADCGAGSAIRSVDAAGAPTCVSTGGITGTLTSGTIPRATGTSSLGNSSITDTGTAATVADFAGTINGWTFSGTVNDGNPAGLASATGLAITGTSTPVITGIQGGRTGRFLLLHNVGANAITLANQSVSSTTNNRIITATGSNVTLPVDASIMLFYFEGAVSRWRALPVSYVTGVTAGTNMDGGGTSGTITLDLEPTITLAGEANTDTIDILNSATNGSAPGKLIDALFSGTVDGSTATVDHIAADIYNNASCVGCGVCDARVVNKTALRLRASAACGAGIGLHVDEGTAQFDESVSVAGTASVGGLQAGNSLPLGYGLTVSGHSQMDGDVGIGDTAADDLIVAAASRFSSTFALDHGVSATNLTASVNNLSVGQSLYRLTADASTWSITGTDVAGLPGQFLTFCNVDASDAIAFPHNSGSSTIKWSNRDSVTWSIGPSECIDYRYDNVTGVWRHVGLSGNNVHSLDVTGAAVLSSSTTVYDFRGNVISPSSISGTVNDWAPTDHATASYVRVNPSASTTITGLSGGANGRKVRHCSIANNLITYSHENSGSTLANRIDLGDETVHYLYQDQCVTWWYDGTTSRWKLEAASTWSRDRILVNRMTVNGTWESLSSASSNTNYGKIDDASGAPSISACGTSPTVTGGRFAGVVTVGTGTVTACTVTHAAAFSGNAPACVVTPHYNAGDFYLSANSTSAFTITVTNNAASQKFAYVCVGDA